MSSKITWKNEKRKIKDLKNWGPNPRKGSKKQEEDLNKSLTRFNLADPIIVNTDNTIVGGHFLVRVLKEKKVDEVDVRVPNRKLTEKEVQELNIRLNKNTGEFDWEGLANFDEKDLVEYGFDEIDIAKKMLGDLGDLEEEVDFDYPFGTINAYARIGDHTAEIEEKEYNDLVEIIEEAGGLGNLLIKLIEEEKEYNDLVEIIEEAGGLGNLLIKLIENEKLK